ncbi:MAG TPA: iron-containing alcohol dehydrogenase [Candidatus Baltobacteraceae bacterium]|jgi:alcohol dehydrogenase|nr:iron-containing alcohol dehydrogenase [Candidatus Baltobacteraceae bacterium]
MNDFLSFDHNPRTRIVFGNGRAESAGELARQTGLMKVLLVTDPGVMAAGHAERVRQSLRQAKIQTVLFDSVHENPTTIDIDACLNAAREASIDGIVGLGGGSSMDTAKGCNFLLTNGGRMQDYWGLGKAKRSMLPFIAIPTTAGTGSECQSFALIANAETHQKMACGDPKAAARIAILDPLLTVSQPPRVSACTGIDALSHALETAVTRKRNALSLSYSRESFRLCNGNLGRVLQDGDDLEARAGMLLGAALAGLAIENSMLGAAHAAANPLSAHFHLVHGQAVGMMLPAVIRFNAADAETSRVYDELAPGLAERVDELLNLAGIPRSLADCGVRPSAIPQLAAEAAKQWTAGFNPRQAGEEDFAKLFEAAFEPRR